MPEDVTEIKTFQRSSPPSSGLLYSRSSFLKTCAAFFASKLKNFGNIFFQFPILIICKSSFHSRFWRMDLYQWRRLGRHSLIALIALLRLPRSRISNLIVGHTGIWGSRDQLSIVFALRNESKIFSDTPENWRRFCGSNLRCCVFLAEKRCKMTQDCLDCWVDRSVRHDLSMSVPLTPFKAKVFITSELSKNSKT